MRYNTEKFRGLVQRRDELHGAVVKAGERRRQVQDVLRRLRGELARHGENSTSPSKGLEVAVRETQAELEQLTAASERARQRWQEFGAIVSRCEEFLRSKGIPLPQTRTFTHDAGGMPR